MAVGFQALLPADFEDLARDLIGRELGVRFEAFGPGPDGGIDGRHAAAGQGIILQAKHLEGSPVSTLKAKMRLERPKIDRLQPMRYVLATSRSFSPQGKDALVKIIGPSLIDPADIFGPDDLRALLRKFPDVERAHVKLWLSSPAMLEAMLRPAAAAFTAMRRQDIADKLRVYAPNPSFGDAHDRLETHKVLIVTGPPGVGKSTLAEMLAWSYLADGWELVAIRNLDDGLASLSDHKKQVFFFDDFLGAIALDPKTLSATDSTLARFMKRVRNGLNARFILTTRAHIFEEARRLSEPLSDRRIDLTKFVLDVGSYTRALKARILYNHLLVAKTPICLVQGLLASGLLPRIIDHKNYSPRIIEWMTDQEHVQDLTPEAYATAFVAALDDPSRLWDVAFRTGIADRCRHLLLALFLATARSIEIDDLRRAFDPVHQDLCRAHGLSSDPKDFEESLRILEGGFIAIRDRSVSFINPSLRDYLAVYLDDPSLLRGFAGLPISARWSRAVWRHGTRHLETQALWPALAEAFLPAAASLADHPIWRTRRNGHLSYEIIDLGNADRIDLLMTWDSSSGEEQFAEIALQMASRPPDHWSGWRDGEELVKLVSQLGDADYFRQTVFTAELIQVLENALIAILRDGVAPDELDRIADALTHAGKTACDTLHSALHAAIYRQIDEIAESVAGTDSESTLEDHIRTMEKLAPVASVPPDVLAGAVLTVRERIAAIEEETVEETSAPIRPNPFGEAETFTNAALLDLFSSLLSASAPPTPK